MLLNKCFMQNAKCTKFNILNFLLFKVFYLFSGEKTTDLFYVSVFWAGLKYTQREIFARAEIFVFIIINFSNIIVAL